MEMIVRLAELKLLHFKNVCEGKISMPNIDSRDLDYKQSEILGLYGQNGSGKTAVVDALYYLQKIMTGESVDEEFINYMDVNSKDTQIEAYFNIFSLEGMDTEAVYNVAYKIHFQKNSKGKAEILNESLEYKKDKKRSKLKYERENIDGIFTPKTVLDLLVKSNHEAYTDLLVAKKIAEKLNCSYIFGDNSREIFDVNDTGNFKEYSEIIRALFYYALRDLFVIRNIHSGVISANVLLPMAFRVENENVGSKGDFAIPLAETTVLDEDRKNLLDTIVKQINLVLYTIIPNMKIDVKDYGEQLTESGEKGHRVELVSIRENMPSIPIRMESEGIIKIISILHALIQAFGNPSICLVIDELDAGIFEYMLGELLQIFDKHAKGQLIFTSHNLRALEMLNKSSIMFSTANPDNRYIRMKNIKSSNNLRDVYLRAITLGGQSETIYDETDSLKIARAFRKAGREVYNG